MHQNGLAPLPPPTIINHSFSFCARNEKVEVQNAKENPTILAPILDLFPFGTPHAGKGQTHVKWAALSALCHFDIDFRLSKWKERRWCLPEDLISIYFPNPPFLMVGTPGQASIASSFGAWFGKIFSCVSARCLWKLHGNRSLESV